MQLKSSKYLQSCCGQEGFPVGVSLATYLKKALTEDHYMPTAQYQGSTDDATHILICQR